ncbi:MAG TPA: hypothetical protein VJN96_22165 [Vicinamibacterales bacterium]|nr:hypothetical protein [Vicinamibacterales bacterium]
MTPSPSADRRAIGVLGAFVEGWRRALRAPAIWIGLFTMTLLLVWAISDVAGFGTLRGRLMTPGIDLQLRDFAEDVLALGGPLAGESVALDERVMARAVAARTIGQVLVLIFLFGGVLDRLARGRRVGPAAFFGACGGYFGRLLRLYVLVGLAYWTVARATASVPALGIVLFALVNLVADFARVRAVVEDRRSAVGALLASGRFLRRHAVAALGLSVMSLIAWKALNWAVVTVMGPGGLSYLSVLLLVILISILAQMALAASEIVYFQHALAHADYTAAPLPIWPDSPAAEAIENLVEQRGPSGPGA